MSVYSTTKEVRTKGFNDTHDITGDVEKTVSQSKIREGIATVFIPGSTAGITTIEFESGVVKDLSDAVNRLIPQDILYKHNEKWHDDNGFSHVRAALFKPSLTVPISKGKLQLGTWQQIVLIDFDIRNRSRRYVVTVVGE